MTSDHEEPLRAVSGVLMSSALPELARPLRQLREGLAVMLEAVERHIATAEGPEPLPWSAVEELRQELADAYLLSREIARVASELAEFVGPAAGEVIPVDINHLVESALDLLRPRFAADTEIFVDLGSIPPVRAAAGQLMPAIAKMLLCCADSAAARPGSALAVCTRVDRDDDGQVVLIAVSDNGCGRPGSVEAARQAVEPVVQPLGGVIDAVADPHKGSAFECRLPLSPGAAPHGLQESE